MGAGGAVIVTVANIGPWFSGPGWHHRRVTHTRITRGGKRRGGTCESDIVDVLLADGAAVVGNTSGNAVVHAVLFVDGAVVARKMVETITVVVFNVAVVVAAVVVAVLAVVTANVVVTVVFVVIVVTTVGVHARSTKSREGPVSMQSGRFAPPPTVAVGRTLRPRTALRS